MKSLWPRGALLFPLLIASWVFAGAASAQFSPGHVMVVRVGDGAAALTTASTPVFIDEYQSNGVPVRTITVPAVVVGANAPFTVSGTSTGEGALSMSTDGKYLVLAGYAVVAGTGGVSATTSASVNRVVARVDGSAAIDVTTRISNGFNGSSVRAAATDDGTRFWVAGTAADASGGVHYVPLGSSGTSVQILSTPNNCRVAEIQNGQLYGSSGSNSFTNVFTIGTGTPTTSGQAATALPGFPTATASPYAFAMNAAGTICYVADDRTVASGGGIQKWTFDGSTWTLSATLANGLGVGDRGVAVDWSGANPRIFATTTAASANALVTFVDDGTATPMTLATAPTNTVFRGVVAAASAVTAVPLADAGATLRLSPILPTPSRTTASVEFSLPRAEHAKLELFDSSGRRVAVWLDADVPAGTSHVAVDVRQLRSGMYWCALRAGRETVVRKMLRL